MQFDSGHSKNVVSLEDYRQNRRPIFQLPDNYFDQFNRYLIPENYRVDSSGLYRCDDATDNDSKRYLVANFIAWTAEERKLSDVNKPLNRFTFLVSGLLLKNRQILDQIEVNGNEICSFNWLNRQWGIAPRIEPKEKTHFTTVFHIISRCKASQREIFTRTGWHQIDKEWRYLLPETNLGASSYCKDVECNLSAENLKRFKLPATTNDQGAALSAMRNLLNIGSSHIAASVFASICLPPLGEHFRQMNQPLNFIEFFKGESNCGKSSLSLLTLSAFGNFDNNSYPLSFEDSYAAMLPIISAMKDVPCVIDDFHPVSTPGQSTAEMNRLADKLSRLVGDGNMGKRANKEILQPKTFAIASGEMLPNIKSGLKRYLVINMKASDLDYHGNFRQSLAEVSILQEAVSVYIRWIAKNWDHVQHQVKELYACRKKSYASKQSIRPVESAAMLATGFEIGLLFLQEHAAIDQDDLCNIRASADKAFEKILEENLALHSETKEADLFIETLLDLLNGGQAVLLEKKANRRMPSKCIGFFDDNNVYLLTEQSYSVAKKALEKKLMGELLPQKELWKDLASCGYIDFDPIRKRHTRQVRLKQIQGGNIIDVLQIARDKFGDIILEDSATNPGKDPAA